jgi:hypothetical protein
MSETSATKSYIIYYIYMTIKDSLVWYTGGEYEYLNDVLRSGKDLDPNVAIHWHNIKEAFRTTLPSIEPITVYRGKKTDTIRPIVTPLSTSKTIRGTEDFVGIKCCIMIITVSPGTRYIDLSTISDIPSESEILLPPDGSLILTAQGLMDLEYPRETKSNVKVLYLTYVPPAYVVLPISMTSPEETSAPQLERTLTIESLVSLIDNNEYEFYDSIDDIKDALRISAPNSNSRDIHRAAEILWQDKITRTGRC